MGLVSSDDGWRLPDWLWGRLEPLLPAAPSHPLGCHNPRVPDRDAMDAILLVLRTGMQWNALNATGVCSSSSAHRRFQEWEQGRRLPRDLAARAARLRRDDWDRLGLVVLRRSERQGAARRPGDRAESH
jgi:transposase